MADTIKHRVFASFKLFRPLNQLTIVNYSWGIDLYQNPGSGARAGGGGRRTTPRRSRPFPRGGERGEQPANCKYLATRCPRTETTWRRFYNQLLVKYGGG
jgi:hypothetical protein